MTICKLIYLFFLQYLKVLRHPAILKYHASYEDSSETYLITEPVVPVEAVIEDLDVREIVAGLFCIVQALDFLHDKVMHKNKC